LETQEKTGNQEKKASQELLVVQVYLVKLAVQVEKATSVRTVTLGTEVFAEAQVIEVDPELKVLMETMVKPELLDLKVTPDLPVSVETGNKGSEERQVNLVLKVKTVEPDYLYQVLMVTSEPEVFAVQKVHQVYPEHQPLPVYRV